MKQALIYLDKGVSSLAFRQLYLSLQQELPLYSINVVNHRYLIEENWEKKTSLFILPGGRDVPYHAVLQGEGNKRIISYVKQGGSYLGLCAGGYYASAYIEFEKGGTLEVCGNRELAFFPGRAVGPAYGLRIFEYGSERGARAASINWKKGLCHAYFNGGCFFENPETYPSIQVLARYHDLPNTPAAVIQCSVGAGRAILSGIHPEYESNFLLSHRNISDSSRRAFWNYLLNELIKN